MENLPLQSWNTILVFAGMAFLVLANHYDNKCRYIIDTESVQYSMYRSFRFMSLLLTILVFLGCTSLSKVGEASIVEITAMWLTISFCLLAMLPAVREEAFEILDAIPINLALVCAGGVIATTLKRIIVESA